VHRVYTEAQRHRNAKDDGPERPERPGRRHCAGHNPAPQAFGPQPQQGLEILELIDLIFEKGRLADMASGEPGEHQERRTRHNGVQAPDHA
jgi:hypothetical protein